jgi:hypothetical protein
MQDMFATAIGHPLLGNKELDEMLKNRTLIPEGWKRAKLFIYFLGSINVDEDGESYVRVLSWNGDTFLEDRFYLWRENTRDSFLTPTVFDKNLNSTDQFAVVKMEIITRPSK